MTTRPLSGLTVREHPDNLAIRYCGRLLAVLGARVEQVGTPSTTGLGQGGTATAALSAWLDQGKLVAADASGPADLVIAADPDAAGPATALRLALGWFDRHGPYRDWIGTDGVIQAMAGVAFVVGPRDGPPLLPVGHAPQIVAGATGLVAALAGLIGRRNGWRGRLIEVDALSANLCFMESQAAAAALTRERTQRKGINRFSSYPAGVYRAASGWIGVTAQTPAQWTSLCDMIGLPELGRTPRYQVSANRSADFDTLEPILARALLARPAAAWLEEGQRRRIPLAPVPEPADLPLTPHWQERGAFAPVGPGIGPRLPFQFHPTAAEAADRPVVNADQPLPLAGVNVLDLSMGWAGPLAARHFADLGADVVKVESCGYFDWWRGWDGDMTADPPPYELRPSFLMVNRNKRAITLDLKTDDGRALLRRLAAGSDVLIENHAPGVLDKLGVGALTLAEENPGLVALSMGAFGARGPWRHFRAYGSTVEQASGLPSVNGHEGDAPTMQHVAYGDPVAGIYGALACLVGLHGRRHQRRGTWIDLAQVECLFQLGADAILARSVRDTPLPRQGSAHPGSLLRVVVPVAGEDAWLAVTVETPGQMQALCALTGGDPADPTASVAAWARGRQAEEAARTLQAAGVPAGFLRPAHDLPGDAQYQAAGTWQWLDRAFVGRYLAPAAPYRIDSALPPLLRPAPTLGQHNNEILGGRLGVDTAELERLERTGVIGTRAARGGGD